MTHHSISAPICPRRSLMIGTAACRSGHGSPAWRRERRNLRDLSDATLRDIGLTRADIEHEIDRLR